MTNILNIADINIELNGLKSLFESEYLKEFKKEYCEFKDTIDWKINFYIEKPQPIDSKYLVYSNSTLKIYIKDGIEYKLISLSALQGEDVFIINDKHRKTSDIYIYPDRKYIFPSKILDILSFEMILLKHKGIILHSSFVNYLNNGILFTGPSGIGKSTQAKLWEDFMNAKTINGDRAAIREKDGKFYAYGSPYCGSSNICHNECVPLKSIVVLKQGNENKIRRLGGFKSYKHILSQIPVNQWDKESNEMVYDIIDKIINNIPIIELSCLPNFDSVLKLKDFIENN